MHLEQILHSLIDIQNKPQLSVLYIYKGYIVCIYVHVYGLSFSSMEWTAQFLEMTTKNFTASQPVLFSHLENIADRFRNEDLVGCPVLSIPMYS